MITKKEVFKVEINGFDKTYEVSVDGKVYSTNYNKTGEYRELSQNEDKDGYRIVTLMKNAKSTRVKVHRLVAQSFIPNPRNKPCVNHVNEIKNDNRVENLEWVTYRENTNHGTAANRISSSKINGLTSKPVKQISKEGVVLKIWPSVNEAQRFGFNQAHISKVASTDSKYSKYKSHKGFCWEYV